MSVVAVVWAPPPSAGSSREPSRGSCRTSTRPRRTRPPQAITEEAANEEHHPRAQHVLAFARVDPTRLTGLALTVALGILVLGAVAIGALLVMVQHNVGLAHYDLSAARWGGTRADVPLDADAA